MGVHRGAKIIDADGVRGRLRTIDASDPDHPQAVVELGNGAYTRIPFQVLEPGAGSGYRMASRWSDFPIKSSAGIAVPVVEEKVTVAVRPAPPQTVRVRRRLVTEQRTVEVPIWHERIEVERIPVDAFVERAPEPHYEGDTLIFPCIEEVPVVEVRLRVREELRVRVVREQRVHREIVALRRHDIDVQTITTPPDERRDEPEGEEV